MSAPTTQPATIRTLWLSYYVRWRVHKHNGTSYVTYTRDCMRSCARWYAKVRGWTINIKGAQ